MVYYAHDKGGENLKAIINACIYDFHTFRENCYIIFGPEIEDMGDMENFPGAEEVYDARGCIVMPGLVNCHTHIYSAFSRGMDIPFNPKNFKDILEQLWWKLDRELDCDSVTCSALVYGIDCIRSGVTSIIDHHASGLCVKGSLDRLKKSICTILGLRGIFCFETSDRFDIDECIEENMKSLEERSDKWAGLFGMHASMSLSDESMSKIASSAGNLPIHIHVAESSEDEEDCVSQYGKSIIERLDSFNLLNMNSILAHCVHINETEARIIGDRGCMVALNPTSNMNNAVGLADYDLFKRNGIKCVAGNDGLGANITRDYLNIVFAMKNRLKSPVKFNLDDLTAMIDNGYDYTGRMLGIKIGRLQKGYKADMIAVPYTPPTPMTESNALGHIFFGLFDSFHPRDVWASGQCLMKDYNLTFDTSGTYKEAVLEASRVWKRVKEI
jgi:putative selenium metabolism protein SsnA